MDCPYKKPSYLTEEESKNCYATNRGWVILKPHGKYDIVESISGLDDKIRAWETANGIDTPVNDIPKEFELAKKKHDKSVLEHELEVVKGQLKEVETEIKKAEANMPVLKTEVKEPKAKKETKVEKKTEVAEEKVETQVEDVQVEDVQVEEKGDVDAE